MKKNIKLLLVINIIIISCIVFVGCSSNKPENPKELIKDTYQNQQYTISFYNENLDKPIPEITYSSKNMPRLPIPEKVGYIFDGWYLDKEYTIPYSIDILYLYMRDVTLYAKWSKEKFTQNGVYDIKLNAKIDRIINKGELADKYPFNDLTKDINYEKSCIEKSENGLQLKLQFNTTELVPFGSQPIYIVSPSSVMGDKIHIVEQITPDNSNDKILFFNIDKLNLSDVIYLDVTSISYANTSMSNIQRQKTKVDYVVALTIEKLIGFSEPFVDAKSSLENNCNYLIKTHYDSMAESYNPVYSFIQVDNEGNYTLIKPFMPYAGLLGSNIKENFLDNFYDRAMTFSPMQLYYKIKPDREYTKQEISNAMYIPELLNGGTYGEYTVEFHADTGMYYMLYDLGKDLDCQFVISGSTTGYMEMTSGMGRYNLVMTLDTDHIVKVNDIDFKPLEGAAYVYNDKIQYYPGDYKDLNERNLIKDSVDKYGISTNIFNYYYSAKNKDSQLNERKIYSHKYVVTPDDIIATMDTKDNRYQIANFNVVTSIYGYNPQVDYKLFGDSMTVNTFGGSGRRETLEILTGKSVDNGEIRLDTLFLDKVNPLIKLNEVKAKIYDVKNGIIDYSNFLEIPDIRISYNFTKPVAIKYNYKHVNDECETLVYLKNKQKPLYNDNHQSEGYKQYDLVDLHDFTYKWGEVSKNFSGNLYQDVEGITFDTINVVIVNFNNGLYNYKYLDYTSNKFVLNNIHMSIGYELNNEFRETYMVYLDYYAKQNETYFVKDGDEIVDKGGIYYDDKGKRRPIQNFNSIADEIDNIDQIIGLLSKNYTLTIGNRDSKLYLSYCQAYTSMGISYLRDDFVNAISNLLNVGGYGVFQLNYSNGFDNYHKTIVYNVKVDGKNKFEFVNYDYMFTNFEYILNRPIAILPNNITIDNLEISVRGQSYENKYSLLNSNGQYKLKFLTPGTYDILCNILLDYDTHGNRVLNGESYNILLTQTIKVLDSKQQVNIKYITDEDHPFREDIRYEKGFLNGKTVFIYTISQLITESIVTLNQSEYFMPTNDILYAWSPRPWDEYTLVDAKKMFDVRSRINDPIKVFGTNEILFYSIWDKGISITIDRNKEITNMDTYIDNSIKLDNDRYKGYYIVKTPKEEELFIPEGYYFTGWTVLETGVFYPKNNNEQILTRDSITVKATFIKDILIRFDVNTDYGEAIESEHILENNVLEMPIMESNQEYKFIGYRLATKFDKYGRSIAISSDNFDFMNPITNDIVNYHSGRISMVVFVAVFEDFNGNEVWH